MKHVRLMVTGLLLFTIIFSGMTVQAQTNELFTVHGRVFDTDGKTPRDGVEVIVTDQNTGDSLANITSMGGWYSVNLANMVNNTNAMHTIEVRATFEGKTDGESFARGPVSDSPKRVDLILQILPDTTPPKWDTTVGIQSARDTGKGGQVIVTYGTATDADTPPVKYNVYYSTSSPATSGTKLSNVGPSPYTVTELTNGQRYYFTMRVEDSAIPPNEDTNTVELSATPTAPPAAPGYAVGGAAAPRDTDGDGISDIDEMLAGTDWKNPCDPNPESAACLAVRPPTPTPAPAPVVVAPTPVVTPVVTPIVTPTLPPVLAVPPVIPLYVILIAIVVALVIIAGAYWVWRRP